MSRLICGLLAGYLLLSPLLFWGLALESYEFSKVALLRALAALLIVIGILVGIRTLRTQPGVLRAGWRGVVRDPLALGILALLGSAASSTYFGVNPALSLRGVHSSWFGFTTLAAYGVLFFATRAAVRAPSQSFPLLAAAAIAAGPAALHGLFQVLGMDPVPHQALHTAGGTVRAAGTLGNAIFLGGYLAMAAPAIAFLSWLAWQGRHRAAGIVFFGLFWLSTIIVLATFSRGAWGAFAIGIAILLLGWWRAGATRMVRITLLALGAIGIATLVLAVATGYLGPFVSGVEVRFAKLLQTGTEARLFIWSAVLRIVPDFPWFGVGPDALGFVYPQYAGPEAWTFTGGRTAMRAHNEVLHLAATQGGLGLGALALAGWGLLRTVRLAWLRSREPIERMWVAAVVAGIAAFAAYSMLGFTVVSIGSLFCVYIGALSGFGSGPETRERDELSRSALLAIWLGAGFLGSLVFAANSLRSQWLLPTGLYVAVLLIAILAASTAVSSNATRPRCPAAWRVAAVGACMGAALYAFVFVPLRVQTLCRGAVDLTEAGRPDLALPILERVVAQEPHNPTYWRRYAAAYAKGAELEPDRERKRQKLVQARDALLRALEIAPREAWAQLSLARVESALSSVAPEEDNRERVFAAFDRALTLAPTQPPFALDAARAALALGDLDRASGYARHNLERLPSFAPSRFLLGKIAMERREFETAAFEIEAALGANWYGQDGRGRAWTDLAYVRLQLGRPDAALEAALEAVAARPEAADPYRAKGIALVESARKRGCQARLNEAQTALLHARRLAPRQRRWSGDLARLAQVASELPPCQSPSAPTM